MDTYDVDGPGFKLFPDHRPIGFEHIDELAAALDIEGHEQPTAGISLQGRSGRWYDFSELVLAHVALMRRSM